MAIQGYQKFRVRNERLTSALITVFLIFLLILSGPVSAMQVVLFNVPSSISQGQPLNFKLDVTIPPGEQIPVVNLTIVVKNSTGAVIGTYAIAPNGANLTPGISATPLDVGHTDYGYGYGYGTEGGQGFYFGYGYGYGYSSILANMSYNITIIDTVNYPLGYYNISVLVHTGTPDVKEAFTSLEQGFRIVALHSWSVGLGGDSAWTNGTWDNMTEDLGDHYLKLGLFADNFDDNNENWDEAGGSWGVSSGRYGLTGYSSHSRTRNYTPPSQNYTVLGIVHTDPDDTGQAGLMVRWSGSNYYACTLAPRLDLLVIRKYDNVAIKQTDLTIAGNTDYLLKFDVEGSNLTCSELYSGTTISKTDTSYTGDYTGLLKRWQDEGNFDDFRVVPNPWNEKGNYTSEARDAGSEDQMVSVLFASKPAGTSCDLYVDKDDGNFALVQADVANNTNYTIPPALRSQTYRVRLSCDTNDITRTPAVEMITVYEGVSGPDTTPPTITFVPPTDPDSSTITDRNYTSVNVTLSESGTAWLEWNGTNESMDQGSWYKTKMDLANGTYTYRVWANDSAGNLNVSETRTVTIAYSPSVALHSWTVGLAGDSAWTSGGFDNTTEDLGDGYLKLGLFADNWDDNNENWDEVGGSWGVSSGRYGLTGYSSHSRTRNYTPPSQNYTVLGIVHTDPDDTGQAGLMVRWSGSNYYACTLAPRLDLLVIRKYDNVAIKQTDLTIAGNTDYLLKFDVEGSNLTCSELYSGTTISKTDTSYTGDYTGLLKRWQDEGNFDDFRVVPNPWNRMGDYTSEARNAGSEDQIVSVLFASKPAGTSCDLHVDKDDGNFALVQANVANNTNYTISSGDRNQTYRVRLSCDTNDITRTPAVERITVYEG